MFLIFQMIENFCMFLLLIGNLIPMCYKNIFCVISSLLCKGLSYDWVYSLSGWIFHVRLKWMYNLVLSSVLSMSIRSNQLTVLFSYYVNLLIFLSIRLITERIVLKYSTVNIDFFLALSVFVSCVLKPLLGEYVFNIVCLFSKLTLHSIYNLLICLSLVNLFVLKLT